VTKANDKSHLGASTIAVHAGGYDTSRGAPVASPVVQSATFLFRGGEEGEELLYSRYGNNPNQRQVGAKVAALEGMEAGTPLASGMAATAMTLLALADAGDHIVASRNVYGATRRLLSSELSRRGVETTLVDTGDPAEWSRALKPRTKVFFLEVPTNPTLRVVDPRPLADLAHGRGITVVADTTFASPVNLRAQDVGVDVVIHSATKYLGGHSDLIAGVVAGKREVVDRIMDLTTLYGPSLDPHACWLLDRGMRTLDVRVRRQNESALAVARWLEEQPSVTRVTYPGLPSHPDHAIAKQLLKGFGGMVSFVVAGGPAAADRFMDALELALPAPSLGGVETLVSQPRHTSHAGWTPAEREAAGIPDGFVRLSIGVEDVRDLIADFSRALTSAAGVRGRAATESPGLTSGVQSR
jgi:cystathionine beta-lyase/cystathionine gamma-synthase